MYKQIVPAEVADWRWRCMQADNNPEAAELKQYSQRSANTKELGLTSVENNAQGLAREGRRRCREELGFAGPVLPKVVFAYAVRVFDILATRVR
jgi:hypothetical protein